MTTEMLRTSFVFRMFSQSIQWTPLLLVV